MSDSDISADFLYDDDSLAGEDHYFLDDDNLEGEEDLYGSDQPPPRFAPPLVIPQPTPGLFGAFGWTLIVLLIHIIAVIIVMTGIMIHFAITNPNGMPNNPEELVESMMEGNMLFTLTAGEMGLFVIGTMIVVRIKLGRDWSDKLGFSRFSLQHLLLIFLAVIPVSLLGGQLYQLMSVAWEKMGGAIGMLGQAAPINPMEALAEMAAEAPLYWLIPVIALAPAIGEELIFRGIISRGLLARYGMGWGIWWTSILFALVHVHPAHVLAVIPLGIFIHYVYLVTRSFWAPMLVHFLNNSWAVIAIKMAAAAEEKDVEQVEMLETLNPAILLTCLFAVVMIMVTFWKTRTKYVNPEGTPCTPGFLSLEVPPNPHAMRVSGKADAGIWMLTIGSLFLFAGSVVFVGMNQ